MLSVDFLTTKVTKPKNESLQIEVQKKLRAKI